MDTCKNCNEPTTGKFCSNCGQPAELRRIDKYYILHEITDFFRANKGFLYTVKGMLIAPGKTVRQFIATDRHRFVKPITFVIITALIYSLVNYFFQVGIKDIGIYGDEFGATAPLILHWMFVEYPGYSGILTGLFAAFWVKLFFRKSGYNFFEVFILMCFISGISALFTVVVIPFQGLADWNIIQISGYVFLIYIAWAIGQFFDGKKIKNYVKGLLAYFVAMSVLGILIAFVGAIIDLLRYDTIFGISI
ncbi:MAG: DUF3667 domain-containing protein [Bacteroidales bacterium]|nr:DUF3667 domain-containing protein [Bacteroidales bacterium]